MKIRAQYNSSRQHVYYQESSKKYWRPPARLLRNHRKVVRSSELALLSAGHRLTRKWRYCYGQSVNYCDNCQRWFRIKLADPALIVTSCRPLDSE